MRAPGRRQDDRTLDGKNPLPVLTGREPHSPHRSLYFTYRDHAALRMGDHKIVRTKPDEPWQLFNLADDLSESSDLAADNPQLLHELAAEFLRWESDSLSGRP